ncbi:MAG: D-alanyl-D-alanine carboxypeptidase/D-alanyl-D-alanine-endopeptidase [Neomegalonema sp.]|nr:D-alanyl-D-alanine carboxypeptidase/D-alanyl-D-alanine-endopeptidase [Neomegalonema sp.]
MLHARDRATERAPAQAPVPSDNLNRAARSLPPLLVSRPLPRPDLAAVLQPDSHEPEAQSLLTSGTSADDPAVPASEEAILIGDAAQAGGLSEVPVSDLAPEELRPSTPKPDQPVRVEPPLADAPKSGRVGFLLVDKNSGAVIARRYSGEAFIPASVSKVPTALYALKTLGSDFSFTTLLRGTGAVHGGVLDGDIYLQGGGDPTLDTAELDAMVDQLKAQGIHRVNGRFIYDASALPTAERLAEGQPIDAAYNPSLSGLNLNFNRVLLKWEREKKGDYIVDVFAHASRRSTPAVSVTSDVAQGKPVAPLLRYHRVASADLKDVRAGSPRELEAWEVSSKVLGRRGSRWLPVQKPGEYVATTFWALAADAGITLPQPQPGLTPKGARILATHVSAPLSKIVRGMLYYSTNVTAEALGLVAAGKQAAAGNGQGLNVPEDFSAASASMTAWLAQAYPSLKQQPLGERHFRNHSGLSPLSRFSPEAAVSLLNAALDEKFGEQSFAQILPRYRRRAWSNAEVRAKTGTMYYARGLAGQIACKNKPGRYVFALFSSDIEAREAFDAVYDPVRDNVPRGAKSWLRRAQVLERTLVGKWVQELC